jgi:hypothetical protein
VIVSQFGVNKDTLRTALPAIRGIVFGPGFNFVINDVIGGTPPRVFSDVQVGLMTLNPSIVTSGAVDRVSWLASQGTREVESTVSVATPAVAGFDLSTTGRFSAVHRGSRLHVPEEGFRRDGGRLTIASRFLVAGDWRLVWRVVADGWWPRR